MWKRLDPFSEDVQSALGSCWIRGLSSGICSISFSLGITPQLFCDGKLKVILQQLAHIASESYLAHIVMQPVLFHSQNKRKSNYDHMYIKKKVGREKNRIKLLVSTLQQIPIVFPCVMNSARSRNLLMKEQRLLGGASYTAAQSNTNVNPQAAALIKLPLLWPHSLCVYVCVHYTCVGAWEVMQH